MSTVSLPDDDLHDTWRLSEFDRELGALCRSIKCCVWGSSSRAASSWCRASSDGSLATSARPLGVNSWSSTLPPRRTSFCSDLMHDRRLPVCSKRPYTRAVLPLKSRVMFCTGEPSNARVATLVGMTCAFIPTSASLRRRLVQA